MEEADARELAATTASIRILPGSEVHVGKSLVRESEYSLAECAVHGMRLSVWVPRVSRAKKREIREMMAVEGTVWKLAKMLVENSSPSIVRCCGITTVDGMLSVVLERIDCTLSTWIQLNESVPLARKLSILADIASSLRWLHEQKPAVLCRSSLRPDAIALCHHEGRVKAKLFDLSAALRPDAPVLSAEWGPQWILHAPEVLREAAYSPASDVYSFGMLAIIVLVGYQHLLRKQAPSVPDEVERAHPRLASMVRECTASAAADRPTMRHVCAQLALIAGGEPHRCDKMRRIVLDVCEPGTTLVHAHMLRLALIKQCALNRDCEGRGFESGFAALCSHLADSDVFAVDELYDFSRRVGPVGRLGGWLLFLREVSDLFLNFNFPVQLENQRTHYLLRICSPRQFFLRYDRTSTDGMRVIIADGSEQGVVVRIGRSPTNGDFVHGTRRFRFLSELLLELVVEYRLSRDRIEFSAESYLPK